MTFEQWQEAATLQFTIYEKFLVWLRDEYDFDDDNLFDIIYGDPALLEEWEMRYYEETQV